MNLTDNLDKLPKWAQQEVSTLKMRLDEATKELNRINNAVPSNTIVGDDYNFPGSEPTKYLRNNQRIMFKLSKGDVTAHIEKDVLYVSASGISEGDMYIKPLVSNSIKIQLI